MNEKFTDAMFASTINGGYRLFDVTGDRWMYFTSPLPLFDTHIAYEICSEFGLGAELLFVPNFRTT